MRRGTWLTILVVLGFIAYLLWSTLTSQRVECTVAVEFRGQRNTASASGSSETDASEQAQTAACGPLTSSMDDRIACSRRPPVSQRCRGLDSPTR